MSSFISLFSILLWFVFASVPASAQSFESLDESEQRAMADTFQYALENNKSNDGSVWENPDKARSGDVTPVRTFYNAEGAPCREFTQTIIIGDKEELGYGTACRQPDGHWKIVVDEEPVAPLPQIKPAENRTIVYINETPWPAYFHLSYGYPYGYWYPYYYPSYFSFSFSKVYYGGHYYKRSHVKPRHYKRPHIKPRYYYDRRSPERRYYKDYDKRKRIRKDWDRDENYRPMRPGRSQAPEYRREDRRQQKVWKEQKQLRKQYKENRKGGRR